ncbi:eCIS core domain-containing protein [Actinotalea ferrariae]|uniref:eCIS core domain-containing protein n=1 Tax=Actinotalea ferrariae TaxID=1386098 RepID=UPI001C8B8C9C|nr:DUF4157 domain-containing protein [Actinotalea ferrariae]
MSAHGSDEHAVGTAAEQTRRDPPGRAPSRAWTATSNRALARGLDGVSRPEDAHEQAARRLAGRSHGGVTGAAAVPPRAGLDPVARPVVAGLLGDTFDDVTLHTGGEAGRVAQAVGADAVARGPHVLFAPGAYRPADPSGLRLLVHELVHTRQPPRDGAAVHRDGAAVTRTYLVEAAEPEVFLFAGTASREEVGATLYGDAADAHQVQFVPTRSSKVVDGVMAQGARPRSPGALTADALASLRWALDTALPVDVDRTLSILGEASIDGSDEAALTELALRWSQRSDVATAAGGSYFDAYLGALDRRRLSQPHWYTLGGTETTRSALQWLLIETEQHSEQIRKAIELRSTAFTGTTGYTVTDRAPVLGTGDIIGRYYWSDGGSNAIRVLEHIGDDAGEEAAARLAQRRIIGSASTSGLGTGAVIPSPDGGFSAYLVEIMLLDLLSRHPFEDEGGHYYWYHPGTRFVAAHELWDQATRAQAVGDVQSQSADWEMDLIGLETAAGRIRASSGLLPPAFLATWQRADRAMIGVSGKLLAKQPVDQAPTLQAVKAFFDASRALVASLDEEHNDYYPDSDAPSSSVTLSYTTNPYFGGEYHGKLVLKLTMATTPQAWRAVLTDYHDVTKQMDAYLAAQLRAKGDEGKRQAAELEFTGGVARRLDALTLDHPTGRKLRATFYALDTLTAEQAGLGQATAPPMNLLFYTYREGTTWYLVDLTTPRKEKVTDEGGGTATTPPWKLFTELNTRLRFPRGRLYWEMPDGSVRLMTTTEPTTLSDWLRGLGMAMTLLAVTVGTLGAGVPATLLIIGSSAAGVGGAVVEMHEKAEAGVLSQADVVVGIIDIITGLAQAGSAASGRIIAHSALKTGAAAQLATRLDAHVFRQLVGVNLFGQAASFVVTTQQLLKEYEAAKADADATGSDLALRRLLMHMIMSGGMLLMGAHGDVVDMTRGRTLRLDTSLGADGIALPVRPRAEVDAAHDAWVAQMLALDPRAVRGPRTGRPLEPGLVGRFEDPHTAYRAYDATLRRPGEAEVGVFRNARGEYAVMIGRATSVDPPGDGGPWRAVVHFHSNPGNALSMRMPAGADVEGALQFARESGRPVTEFVEAPLPGGGRAVTSYTVTPDGRITVEYVRPGGQRVTQSHADLASYRAELASRKMAVDPSSPHYREMMDDLDALYSGQGGRAPGARTSTGLDTDTQRKATGADADADDAAGGGGGGGGTGGSTKDPKVARSEALIEQHGGHAAAARQTEEELGPIIEKLRAGGTKGGRIDPSRLTEAERQTLEEVFPDLDDLGTLTLAQLQAARGRSGSEAMKYYRLQEAAIDQLRYDSRPLLDRLRSALSQRVKDGVKSRAGGRDEFSQELPPSRRTSPSGTVLDDGLEVDHVVSLDELVRDKRFRELDWADQVVLAHHPENLRAVDASANSSRGKKPWPEWSTTRYSKPALGRAAAQDETMRKIIEKFFEGKASKTP